MMAVHTSRDRTAVAQAPARFRGDRSQISLLRATVAWNRAVTAMATTSRAILAWNTGFSRSRLGSAVISTAPLTSSTSSDHQTQGRNRRDRPVIDWVWPIRPSSLRSTMITDDMTMAMARMWTDWTIGMIHPTDWKVMLIGVWDSQSQNWATWVSIPLSRIL